LPYFLLCKASCYQVLNCEPMSNISDEESTSFQLSRIGVGSNGRSRH
jgi:hypothetical protein